MILVSPLTLAYGQTRDEAVLAAREGRTDDAIRELQGIIAKNAGDTASALDLAVILTWAKRPRDATDVFERTAVAEPPEYVLLAMARAYRDQQRFAAAEQLAQEGLRRFPQTNAWPVLNALLAGDVALAADDRFGALRAYATAHQLAPDDGGIASVMSGILMRLNAPYAAASVSPTPDPGIEAGEAAEMVRWGSQFISAVPAKRFERTDAALARLEVLIREASAAHPVDRGLLKRLRCDRVLALRNRELWNDAIQAASALHEDGEVLPPYVREAEADSFLATEHPDKALRIYKELLAADPKSFVLRRFLFFAQIESEDFDSGFTTIDALARDQAPGIRLPLQVTPIENPDWLEARVLVGQGRQYASMESEAWKRLLPVVEGAPALGYLRANMGSVASDRGWPRLADEEIEIAAELAAEDRGVEIRLAESCLERKRFREAHRRVQNLHSLFPDAPAIQHLVRELAAHDAVELQVDTQATHESGNAANRPGSEFETSARLYSPPFAGRWRALAAFEYSSAQPPEGFVDRIRYGAGAEAQWPDFSLEAIAWNNTGKLSRAGGSLNGTWEPTDHWSLSAGGELYSSETPLRAVLHGITANSGTFRTSYAQNESLSISGGIGVYSFSDGNQRLEGSLSTVRRLITRPHLRVTIRPEFYASRNTRLGAPYFNPQHDEAASFVLQANHVLWRRYERSLRQSVELGGGPYWEAHFRPDWTGQIAYRQTFQINPGLELRYGLDFARRVYDGQPVHDFGAIVSLNKRLGS